MNGGGRPGRPLVQSVAALNQSAARRLSSASPQPPGASPGPLALRARKGTIKDSHERLQAAAAG